MLETPVVFMIFKRPEHTARVFAEIRNIKPRTLLLIADGPRPDHLNEEQIVQETRAIVENGINWDCELLTNYADTNMGLRQRISSGLNWVFEQVEEAIILEDDCLPHLKFFHFCEALLDYYRDEKQVLHISGSNFGMGGYQPPDSYYFSRYPIVWGWATWRRAWQLYDSKMQAWSKDPNAILDHFEDSSERGYWHEVFTKVASGEINSWANIWMLTCLANDGLGVMPSINLISNIGFDAEGTNTTQQHDGGANLPVAPIEFPLQHPIEYGIDETADCHTAETFFRRHQPKQRLSLTKRIKRYLKHR